VRWKLSSSLDHSNDIFSRRPCKRNRVTEHIAPPEPNPSSVVASRREMDMRSVKTTLLWLTGFPLPLILLVALFVHPG